MGHPPLQHTWGTSVPRPCRGLGHAGRVISSDFSVALPAAHVERGTRAASGVRTLAPVRLNVARQVCGEAHPVQLDFWRGWSQPWHQLLPARCCRLRRGRAWRQVVAPSHGAAQPRLGAGTARGVGDASPDPSSSVPTLCPVLGGQCPMALGKGQPLRSWRPHLLWGPGPSLPINGGDTHQSPPSPSPSAPHPKPFWRMSPCLSQRAWGAREDAVHMDPVLAAGAAPLPACGEP